MIRPYQPSDATALKVMFLKQKFDYQCPDFSDPALLSKLVFEKDGKVCMAILARITAEVYFLMDKEAGTPQEKWEAFKELHEASRLDLYGRGLDDASCWLPPQVEKPFGRRLMRLGWGRNNWQSFSRSAHVKTVDLKEELVGV